jgi:hypothetical protein
MSPSETARAVAAEESPEIIRKLAAKAKEGDMTAAKIVLEIAGLLSAKGKASGNAAVQINISQGEMTALTTDPAFRRAIDVGTTSEEE